MQVLLALNEGLGNAHGLEDSGKGDDGNRYADYSVISIREQTCQNDHDQRLDAARQQAGNISPLYTAGGLGLNLLGRIRRRKTNGKRKGISHISLTDIEDAKSRNKRIKLIGMVSRDGDDIVASVEPRELALDDPLANIMGNLNAITYTTDALKDVTIVGPGAGKIETGYALLSDLIALNKMVGR